MKNKIILLASILSAQAFGSYQARLPLENTYFQGSVETWNKTSSVYGDWTNSGTPYDCKTWTPETNTIEKDKPFTQTSNDCSQQQTRSVQAMEISSKTGKTRAYGSPTTEEQVVVTSSTRSATGTKEVVVGLVIQNPVAGKNGIYTIKSQDGSSFQAYVDMTNDGGNWILLARWINSTATTTFNNSVVKGNTVISQTNDSTNYPAIKSGSTNYASKAMFISGNSSWISSYGTWQSFGTFAPNTVISSSGIAMSSSKGSITLHPKSAGWASDGQKGVMTYGFGLWTTYGNGGVCGGANVVGSDKICPTLDIISPTNNNHYDISSIKMLYLKSNN